MTKRKVVYILARNFIFAKYSGLHLLAWDVHFCSLIEQQLWRWMTVSLVGLHVVLCTAAPFAQSRVSAVKIKRKCSAPWRWLAQSTLQSETKPLVFAYHPRPGLCGRNRSPSMADQDGASATHVLYVRTSVYLLVESFVGVRRMPMLLYITMNWPNFLPHIN